MKSIFYLIPFFLFNISNSSIDNNRIESYKYSLIESDSIIQTVELNYPYNITKNDSFKYPIYFEIELQVKDIRDLTLKKNYFWAAYDFIYYSGFDRIYISKSNDTIDLKAVNYITPDYEESDQLYLGRDEIEKVEINDDLTLFQQEAYIENNFYHKWDLRNYPFDTQEIKIKFKTYDDTSVLRMQQAKHIKSSYNKKMDNLLQNFQIITN